MSAAEEPPQLACHTLAEFLGFFEHLLDLLTFSWVFSTTVMKTVEGTKWNLFS